MTVSKASKKTPAKKTDKAVRVKEKRANPASKKKLEILIRQTAALDLRRQGLSYRKIARELKQRAGEVPGVDIKSYDSGLAYKDVIDGMRRLITEQKELAEENLTLDLQRLDDLMEKVYPRAVPDGNIPYDHIAVQDILAILARRESLLNYKSIYDDPNKGNKSNVSFNIDWDKLTAEQLRRIANGEDPIIVIADTSNSPSSD